MFILVLVRFLPLNLIIVFLDLKDMWFIEIIGLPSIEIGAITTGEILVVTGRFLLSPY